MTIQTRAEQPTVVDERPRCWRCNKELGVLLCRPWHINCPRCHAPNKREAIAQEMQSE